MVDSDALKAVFEVEDVVTKVLVRGKKRIWCEYVLPDVFLRAGRAILLPQNKPTGIACREIG